MRGTKICAYIHFTQKRTRNVHDTQANNHDRRYLAKKITFFTKNNQIWQNKNKKIYKTDEKNIAIFDVMLYNSNKAGETAVCYLYPLISV